MSTTEKMTVHKALCELKVIDSRINKAISATIYVVPNKHNNTKISGMTIPDYSEQAKAAYQSAVDLIARRDAIKRAVVKSNAVTQVVVAGTTYTVAEAIEMKNHGMDHVRALMTKLTNDLNAAKRAADAENALLERRGDEYIRNMYGATDMKNLTADAVKQRKEFIESITVELIDPLHVADKIAALDKLYHDFMIEIDAALSTSNAVTEIEISY